jgi:hypothetical protein
MNKQTRRNIWHVLSWTIYRARRHIMFVFSTSVYVRRKCTAVHVLDSNIPSTMFNCASARDLRNGRKYAAKPTSPTPHAAGSNWVATKPSGRHD